LAPDERRASAVSEATIIATNAQSAVPPMSAAHRLAGCLNSVCANVPRVGGLACSVACPGTRVQRLMLILIIPCVSFLATAMRPTAFHADGRRMLAGRRCIMVSGARDWRFS
jgi:hypothetical protein